MADSKKKSTKKIIDVSHPDATPPSGNSKSVIVTNRPIMKDPMVVEEAESTEEKPTEKAVAKTEAIIAPLGEATDEKAKDSADKPDKSASESKPKSKAKLKAEDDKKTVAVLAEEAAVKEEEEEAEEIEPADTVDTELDKPEIKLPEPQEASKADEPAAAESAPAEEPATKNTSEGDGGASETKTEQTVTEADDEEAAEQEKHDAEIQKIIDSKKYFLPINSVEKRRSKRVVILGVLISLFLVAAWVDIALDASLIEIQGIKPVTHFFSN